MNTTPAWLLISSGFLIAAWIFGALNYLGVVILALLIFAVHLLWEKVSEWW